MTLLVLQKKTLCHIFVKPHHHSTTHVETDLGEGPQAWECHHRYPPPVPSDQEVDPQVVEHRNRNLEWAQSEPRGWKEMLEGIPSSISSSLHSSPGFLADHSKSLMYSHSEASTYLFASRAFPEVQRQRGS